VQTFQQGSGGDAAVVIGLYSPHLSAASASHIIPRSHRRLITAVEVLGKDVED
jgi:hypothetical protein